MKEIILLKSGEIALKGLNRSTFEDIMAKNARRRLQPLGEFKIWHDIFKGAAVQNLACPIHHLCAAPHRGRGHG